MYKTKIRVREGLLERQREISRTPSLDAQARAIGISRSTLYSIMRGDQPHMNVVAAICDTYGFAPGEVLIAVSADTAEEVA